MSAAKLSKLQRVILLDLERYRQHAKAHDNDHTRQSAEVNGVPMRWLRGKRDS